jgi:hypothetical protein
MNRGKRASGRVRNNRCAVLRDHAGQYEQALGMAIQRANRRDCAVSVACGHGPGVSEWRPGVIVRMVMARTPPPTIRRSRLFGFCVTRCSRNG